MSSNLESLQVEIQKLPFQERAILIQNLISDLDNSEDTDSEELWIREAERRYQQWKEGKIQSKPASAVFREALVKFR
ncbi:Putative addiction module domain-containing protein [Desulfonema limicola]|uniref:Addiction module domain-containing protein n=1 Tax=Desulfonema limicola TaxID=45656 RepID=A0A975B889_9BACT|nr:addiction module protein [Desulfonema limicola]QTA80420.1 Putative addiction module domain-containing protein [Desulfonema limicola]